MNKLISSVLAFCIVLVGSYLFIIDRELHTVNDNGEMAITNIEIYKDTPAWELALAVNDEDTSQIQELAKNDPKLLNYQEPKYGSTLLMWSVGMEKYNSAEMLLECGADPDLALKGTQETPLFLASGYSWVDNDAKKDPKYVKLLLRYGADPDKSYVGIDTPEAKSLIETGTSPLMNSIPCGIEKTKALVEGGADINYKTASGNTAAIEALFHEGNPDYAYYLIVEKKAKVTEPFYINITVGEEKPDDQYFLPVTLLRDWICNLESDEYKKKMKIVEEFARQGVNYWDTEIPPARMEQIQKLYPDTWQEYIEKY